MRLYANVSQLTRAKHATGARRAAWTHRFIACARRYLWSVLMSLQSRSICGAAWVRRRKVNFTNTRPVETALTKLQPSSGVPVVQRCHCYMRNGATAPSSNAMKIKGAGAGARLQHV